MFCRSHLHHALAPLFALAALTSSPLHAAGPRWVPLGPDGGDARHLAIDPQDHAHLFVGSLTGWVYESHNAGASWVRLAQVGTREDLVLDSMVVDPSDSKHLVVGAWVLDHPDGGVFSSHDGGLTWVNQAEMRGQSIRALAISFVDPKVLVAGSLQGVFRSSDGGEHWKLISPEGSHEIHEIASLAIDPKDPKVIYAGTWHLPWKTTDGGEHWENIKNGILEDSDVFSIIVDPATPQTVYASACSGIYKSEDAGGLFKKVQGIPMTARRTRVLLQDPHHAEIVFAGTTEGLYRSNDAGRTWVRTTGPEVIVNSLAIDLDNTQHILMATDRGGVMASDDGGDSFHSSNVGFSARQVTALKRDAGHPETLFAGVVNDRDWGGVFESDNGGVNWAQRSLGLQGRDVFSLGQAPDGTLIAGTAHGLFRLDRANAIWTRVEAAPNAPPVVAAVPADTPAAHVRPAAKVSRNQVGVAKAGPFSRQGGASAIAKGATAKPGTLAQRSRLAHGSAPEVPARFDGAVYALATSGHNLMAASSIGLLTSADEGVTWICAGPRDRVGWRLLATAKDNVVAASLHTLAFSPDSGTTWSPIVAPDKLTQLNAVAVDPSGTVWVGGREGVFVSADAGNTWKTLKYLDLSNVNSIFYDEGTDRVTITEGGASSYVVTVQLPQKTVTFAEAGWNLRFARPLGERFIAATFFDGIVVQPRMAGAPALTAAASSNKP